MLIRCPRCNNIIAGYVAGCWIITRDGREWIGRELISIRCEKCKTVWPGDQIIGCQDDQEERAAE
jgi:folylpolyglutamate synthase/dihydropteroate synthase